MLSVLWIFLICVGAVLLGLATIATLALLADIPGHKLFPRALLMACASVSMAASGLTYFFVFMPKLMELGFSVWR